MRGGKRANGGRKRGSKNKATLEVRALLDRNVKWDIVAKRLFELADGVRVAKANAKGEVNVYIQPPDSYAARILLEYRFGKAPQPLTGDAANPVTVKVIRDSV